MLLDVIIVALTVAIAVWGYSQGVSVGVLVTVGFGVGALLGSRIGPQLLDGGVRDPLAPALALPGALLLGGLLAATLERFGFELRRRLRRRYTLDAVGGALLAGFLGVVLVWFAGAIGARVDGLEETVDGSEILAQLNSVLPPPGPLVAANRSYSLPTLDGPRARLSPASDRVKHDPQVETAARSVVKIRASGCGRGGAGSGWVAGDGLVMTNAHVVAHSERFGVQVEGAGLPHEATPVAFDVKNDVAILRVPGIEKVRALRVAGVPKVNSSAAVLGFPFGKRYKARAARIGPTTPVPEGLPASFRRGKRLITVLRADLGVAPGSSGGPIVDTKGQVVAMIFGRNPADEQTQYAVPTSTIKRQLRRARDAPQRVGTGGCHGDGE